MNESVRVNTMKRPGQKRTFLCFFIVLALHTGIPAQEVIPPSKEQQEVAEAYLEELAQLYDIPIRAGLTSFEARFSVRKSKNQALRRVADMMIVEYAWKAPASENIKITGVFEALHEIVKQPLRNIWKDIAGGGVFADIKGKSLSIQPGEEEVIINLFAGDLLYSRIFFDTETKLLLRMEMHGEKIKRKIRPIFGLSEKKLRLEERSLVTVGESGEENVVITYRYAGFRKLNEFMLPSRLIVENKNDVLEVACEYIRINEEPVQMPEMDPERVKALVKEFEKNYRSFEPKDKLDAMHKLEETGHELAAVAIARRALKDRDLAVRKEAAAILGAMKCRKVVSDLMKAMKPNKDNLEVYLEIIRALGQIGDPKAITSLSKDFWNQKDPRKGMQAAQAKVDALGNIRSKKSVDALIGMLYAAEPRAMLGVAVNLQSALKKLTGKDLGWDRDRWKDWWKKNRARFKLEED